MRRCACEVRRGDRSSFTLYYTSLHGVFSWDDFVGFEVIYLCLRGTVVERRSVTGELSLSYARPAADHLCG